MWTDESIEKESNIHETHTVTLADLQSQLITWREQTKDPLLDPQNLQRLTAEVTAVKGKSRQSGWGYPHYFFGKEPAATTVEPTKKKKKKQ